MKLKNLYLILFAYLLIGGAISAWNYNQANVKDIWVDNPTYDWTDINEKDPSMIVSETEYNYDNFQKSVLVTLVGALIIGVFIFKQKKG